MKKALLFATLLISATLSAQKLDSVKIGGTLYYVYPYAQKAKATSLLLRALSTKDLKVMEKAQEINMIIDYGTGMTGFQQDKAQTKLIRKNAELFYRSYLESGKDVVPSLDKLPDGKYIQYFERYWKFNEKDEIVPEKQKIAGYFNLKDNLLEGDALWLEVNGDTAKYGKFVHGAREGLWTSADRSTDNFYFYSKRNLENLLTDQKVSSIVKGMYVNGVLHGTYEAYLNQELVEKGSYKNGKPSGEWFEYADYNFARGERWIDSLVLVRHYTLADGELVSHKPYIRSLFYSDDFPTKYYSFPAEYFQPTTFDDFWKIKGDDDEDMELPEEEMNSYEGEAYEEMKYLEEGYSDVNYNLEGLDPTEVADPQFWYKGKYILRSKLIDSLGLINKYKNTYEEFWSNGALKFRLQFQNGNLVQEDTIFWDNGKAADVIAYDPQTKQYTNRKLDYAGTVYEVNVYDSLGRFVEQTLDPLYKDKHININGLDASLVQEYYGEEMETTSFRHFEYDRTDTLKTPNLTGRILLSRSWYGDTSEWNTTFYNADERSVETEVKSLNGTVIEKSVREFNEDFSTVRGTSIYLLKDLQLVNSFNGSYSPMYGIMPDSFPAIRVNSPILYEITDDAVLHYKDAPYNGKISVKLHAKKPSVSIRKNDIKLSISNTEKFFEKLQKDYDKFVKTGKTKYPDVLSMAENVGEDYYTGLLTRVFPDLNFMLYSFMSQYLSGGPMTAYDKQITGSYLNGKPNGTWKLLDSKGKVKLECTYRNGLLEGKVKTYDYAQPKPKGKDAEEMMLYTPTSIYDTFPAKTVYYQAGEINAKNGVLNGDLLTYDWRGKVKSKVNYVDGFPEGPASEHNAIASTYMNFENGVLDGIVKTYLHLPGKDSILLYELNYQDGALQGESRSYHTNGKISKRGFFLNGQPIDDYEGYDSLGTRFHYVKFQYSFPVEEKIWEANQLSVRYQFDWRDSIFFRPDDITQTASVQNLLYAYGIEDNFSQPYFGRPSLVEKTGINYHMTKYFPNDSISRDGALSNGKKTGCWQFFSYEGEKLYEVEYFDTLLVLNDSIQFKSKGIYFDYDKEGNLLSRSYIIEKFEKYDCSHTDHYEVRQFYTTWQANDSLHRINGYVKNHYDNGVLQSEGNMKDGLPTGIWKYYDPFGKLNHVGEYKLGKREGRWLSGDLSKSKYLGDICMNPNLPNLEEQMKYQEKMLDIYIRYFKLGKMLHSEYYDLNLNDYEDGTEIQEMEPEEER